MIDARQWDIGKYNSVDFETITVDNTSGGVSLTSSKVNTTPPRKKAFITAESAQIRYRFDGTAPTASVGHLMNPMDSLVLEGFFQMNNFKAIRVGANSGTIMVSYLI